MSHETGLSPAGEPLKDDDLKALVMSIIQGKQDYEQLVTFLEPATREQQGLNSDTALTLALLLKEVEQQAELNDQLRALVNDQGAPAVVLSAEGRLLASNPAADSLFGSLPGNDMAKLGIRHDEFAAFQQRIVQHDGPSLLRTYPDTQQQTPLMFIGVYQPLHQIFVLRAIECQWSAAMDHALKEIFLLTDAEREILACLAQGMSSEQISRQRSSSVGTVRQQIKSLLAKLGASSQVQAAALASAIASQPQSAAAKASPPMALASQPLFQEELIRDTRRVGWRRYGKPGGKPVLVLHGAYFGAGELESHRVRASREGLDVVLVERPGYGRTQPPGKKEDVLRTQLEDIVAVLEVLGWSRVWLESHDFGFVPAVALAARWPQRVAGLLAISPPAPYDSEAGFDHIPRYQRMFIWSARHAFWMIRLLLRLGQMKARKYGPEHWMEMVFDEAPHELPFFESPQGRTVSMSAYAFNLQQHSRGHELDMQVVVATDWTPLLSQLRLPVQVITGARNTTFPIEQVQRLTALHAPIQIQMIEDAGLTLSLTHSDACMDALLKLMEGAEPT